jgi:hypothetical protein
MDRDLNSSGELKAHLHDIARATRAMHALVLRQLAERHPYDSAEWKANRVAWEG